MKLSEITPTPQKFEFLNPETNKSFTTPCFFTLQSINSKTGKKVVLEIQREKLRLSENKDNIDIDGNIKKELIEDTIAKEVSNLVLGWDGLEDYDYSPENAIKLLSENDTILDFVYSKVVTTGNFLNR